ncbi:hypothetical protein B0T25DRAFT_618374 [Lasiosphaeria hispida]|uniref:Uncharacterized protein n=1 Tax=Lasiosphaeria hispida TaxID=260671 RepID=A0AAJ0H548_9PEZI|nr:hypothetical protein B0T25DRAFT_618374 [Lasiosphaeria hispida]
MDGRAPLDLALVDPALFDPAVVGLAASPYPAAPAAPAVLAPPAPQQAATAPLPAAEQVSVAPPPAPQQAITSSPALPQAEAAAPPPASQQFFGPPPAAEQAVIPSADLRGVTKPLAESARLRVLPVTQALATRRSQPAPEGIAFAFFFEQSFFAPNTQRKAVGLPTYDHLTYDRPNLWSSDFTRFYGRPSQKSLLTALELILPAESTQGKFQGAFSACHWATLHVISAFPNSPDLNMIEPAWFYLKRQATKKGTPQSRKETEKAWGRAWRELPLQKIQELIERIPHHVSEVIHCKGGNEYKEGRPNYMKSREIHTLAEVLEVGEDLEDDNSDDPVQTEDSEAELGEEDIWIEEKEV